MRKILLLIFLGAFFQASATRIRNKSGVAIHFVVEGDFNYAVDLRPGQEGNVPLPSVKDVTFVVSYHGADPRYSGMSRVMPYPIWRWRVPEVIDIYLDGPLAHEENLSGAPHRLYQFAIDTTQRRERGFTENI